MISSSQYRQTRSFNKRIDHRIQLARDEMDFDQTHISIKFSDFQERQKLEQHLTDLRSTERFRSLSWEFNGDIKECRIILKPGEKQDKILDCLEAGVESIGLRISNHANYKQVDDESVLDIVQSSPNKLMNSNKDYSKKEKSSSNFTYYVKKETTPQEIKGINVQDKTSFVSKAENWNENLWRAIDFNHEEENIRFNINCSNIYRYENMAALVFEPVRKEAQEKSPVMEKESLEESKKQNSKVLYLKGVDQKVTTLPQLVRLCQCFGNVEIAMYNLSKQYALIRFSSEVGAKYCLKELYGKDIHGNRILVHYSECDIIPGKFQTKDKDYCTPRKDFKIEIPSNRIGHICRMVLLAISFQSGKEHVNDYSIAQIKKLLGNLIQSLPVKKGTINDVFVVEFPCVRKAFEFVMEYNHHYLEQVNGLMVLTFASNSIWH